MDHAEPPPLAARLFELAEYASIDTDRRLMVAGMFNTLNLQLNPDAPPEASAAVPLPMCSLVIVLETSVAWGTHHSALLRVQTEDGHRVTQDVPLPEVVFTLNAEGRLMRYQMVFRLQGLVLPGPGDYEFLLFIDGNTQSIASAKLYIDVKR